MYKKICIFIILLIVCVFFATGFSLAQDQPKYTFGVATYICTHGWSILNYSGMEEMAEKLNVKLIRTMAERDTVKQVNDIEDLVQREVDGLIIMLGNPDTMTEAIKKASDKGIPIAFTNGPFLCDGMNINICTNNYEAGKLIAEGLAAHINYEGNIAIYDYPGLACTKSRCEGAREVFAKYPNINIVADEAFPVGAGIVEKAQAFTEDLLVRFPSGQLQGIFSPADTIGAIAPSAAIDAAGRSDEITIYSMDCLDEIADFIRADTTAVKASYAQRPKEMGRLCVEMLVRFLEGERAIPRQIFLEGILYTKDNIPDKNEDMVSHF